MRALPPSATLRLAPAHNHRGPVPMASFTVAALDLIGRPEWVRLYASGQRLRVIPCDITHPEAVRLYGSSVISPLLAGVVTGRPIRYEALRVGGSLIIPLDRTVAA